MTNDAFKILVSIFIVVVMALLAQAGVSDEEAKRLGKDLTPFGAERAGNAAGTIPAWDGGMTAAPANITFDPTSGEHLPNPFANEKPLYTITARNMDEYADKLTAGQKALLKKYPDTYKIKVYPTHRTAAAPQWVYDNTAKNAVNATLTDDKTGIKGAYGGIPFPIVNVNEGAEAIFNFKGRWDGGDVIMTFNNELVHAHGSRTTGGKGIYECDRPYYDTGGSEETWNGLLACMLWEYTKPSRRKGEITLLRMRMNFEKNNTRKGYLWLPGRRRPMEAPFIGYDTPNSTYGGWATYDDAFMFNGAIDRYNWKLKGKKELIIPYHNYAFELASLDQALSLKHVNPDVMRWELHRVWILEASLKEGRRHKYGKRVMHLDEDTWLNLLEDKYDTRGNLWRTAVGLCIMNWTLPAMLQSSSVFYDLQREDYAAGQLYNEIRWSRKFKDLPAGDFTKNALRKRGKR